MINRLFQLTATLTLLVLLAGIVAAVMTGSSKAFEPAPVFTWLGLMKSTTTEAWEKSGQPQTNPEPIDKVVAAAVQRGGKATQGILKQTPAGQSRADTGKPDPRLAICRIGSVESQNARDLPFALSASFKKSTESIKYKSLMEIQAKLGLPACNSGKSWRYLVSGGRAIDATESQEKIEFRFTGF
ncbi:hypothetical protein [Kamptonema sp. UHCC 0994]|uniref:hypothetical protein n=1 Tax=Kamptonema sp. UHCC 0994 TaxID=3031329 RepID=UPI0023BA1304|nr:hypothetical protein [Kamptonema sp. UHCC 0994]MDF0552192.1 hypothetical protein [Kamptonema sp. UHCC 0994]